jgi:hypothetical protein
MHDTILDRYRVMVLAENSSWQVLNNSVSHSIFRYNASKFQTKCRDWISKHPLANRLRTDDRRACVSARSDRHQSVRRLSKKNKRTRLNFSDVPLRLVIFNPSWYTTSLRVNFHSSYGSLEWHRRWRMGEIIRSLDFKPNCNEFKHCLQSAWWHDHCRLTHVPYGLLQLARWCDSVWYRIRCFVVCGTRSDGGLVFTVCCLRSQKRS